MYYKQRRDFNQHRKPVPYEKDRVQLRYREKLRALVEVSGFSLFVFLS
jgi:hypothetical protein